MHTDFRQFKEISQRLKPESVIDWDSFDANIGPERLAGGSGVFLGGGHELRPHALPALAFHYAKPPDACGALMIRLRQHGDAADRLILAKGAAEDRCGVGGHFRVQLSAGGFEGIQG